MLSDDIDVFINELNEQSIYYSMNDVINKLKGFYSDACNLEDEIEKLEQEED